MSHDASPTGASGLASPGWSFRVGRKGFGFHRFLKLSWNSPTLLAVIRQTTNLVSLTLTPRWRGVAKPQNQTSKTGGNK